MYWIERVFKGLGCQRTLHSYLGQPCELDTQTPLLIPEVCPSFSLPGPSLPGMVMGYESQLPMKILGSLANGCVGPTLRAADAAGLGGALAFYAGILYKHPGSSGVLSELEPPPEDLAPSETGGVCLYH